MSNSPILQPVVALIIWTMIMWIWLYATRLPAMGKTKGLDARKMVGGIGADLDAVLPAHVQWKAHNYNHLLEQPTLFYAICLVLAMVGTADGLSLILAWAYVGLRILHSLIQAMINRVVVRFGVFMLSSLCLVGLVLHAAIAVFS